MTDRRRSSSRLITFAFVAMTWVGTGTVSAQSDSSALRAYRGLLQAYLGGQRDSSAMRSLVQMAWDLHRDSIARVVGREYLDHWLGVRPLSERLAKANIELAGRLMQSTGDSGFSLFYRHGSAVDSVMGKPGFAHGMVESVILEEDIRPRLWHNRVAVVERPDWEAIRRDVNAKFGRSYADSAILDAQLGWYRGKGDWPNLVKYVVEKFDRYGVDSTNPRGVNDWTWEVIFLHSDDPAVLAKAIGWMEVVIRVAPRDATDLDTYANLLYKAGHAREALRWEEKAAELSDDGDIQTNLAKMKHGEPTWPQGAE